MRVSKNKSGLLLFIGLLVFILPGGVLAQTFYSQNSGSFDNVSIWNANPGGGGSQPSNDDFTGGLDFVIQNGHTLTSPVADILINDLTVRSGGTFQADDGSITHVFEGLVLVESGGNFISSSGIHEYRGGISNSGNFNTLIGSDHEFTTNSQIVTVNAVTILQGDVNFDSDVTFEESIHEVIIGSDSQININNTSTVTNRITNNLLNLRGNSLTIDGMFINDVNAHATIWAGTAEGNLIATATGNTIGYTRSSSQTILDVDYFNLYLNSSASGTQPKDFDGTIFNIAGNLDIEDTNLSASIATINLAGNLTGGGSSSITQPLEHLVMIGATPQTINIPGFASFEIGELTVNNETIIRSNLELSNQGIHANSPTTIDKAIVEVSTGDIDIDALITIDGGRLERPVDGLFSTSTAFGPTKMIAIENGGFVRVNNPSSGDPVTFPIGSGSVFTPVAAAAVFSSGASPYMEASLTASEESNVVNSGYSLTKYWTVNSNDLTISAATITMNYDDAEIMGDEGAYISGHYSTEWSTGSKSDVTEGSNNAVFTHGTVSELNGTYTAGQVGAFTNAFITTWSTNDGEINIPTKSLEDYDYDITWTNLTTPGMGDGFITGQSGDYSITGLNSSPDVYQIEITGKFPAIQFNNDIDSRDKILTVEQWGDVKWTSFANAFYGCSNLTVPASDAPDLSSVTDMSSAFHNASKFNQSIQHWDVSEVEDFSNMFRGAIIFDQPLDGWTVAAALDMSHMFRDAEVFNQDLNSWDPLLVQDMSHMFYSADSFDGAIGNWDVSSVTDMRSMFFLASDFNQPLAGWGSTTAMVQDMSLMFSNATSFNQPLNAWDVSSVEDMDNMFDNAADFNQDLNGWLTTSLNSLSQTFKDAVKFNGQIDQWDVDMVSTFHAMFDGASAFNRPLNSWTVTAALSMRNMFRDADAFNQDLNLWTPTSVTDMFGMFSNCLIFNGNITTWDVTNVDDMGNMFFLAPAFNQPIGSWGTKTGGVMDMGGMFWDATSFNQDISAWDVSSVTTMHNMFDGATSFNQDISGWTTTSIQSLSNAFRGASAFDQNLGDWDLTNVSSMVAMLNLSGLSVANYDATLTGWEAQGPPTGLTLGATGLNYCTAESAWVSLDVTYDWNITDAGVDCTNAFIVTNTNDSGVGSLRWTIDNANTVVGANTITFNIPNTDPGYSIDAGNETWTMSLTTDLPEIAETVVLDATSQPGTGNFRIVLDGGGTLTNGFFIDNTGGRDSEFYGFYIAGFENGINLDYATSGGGATIGASGKGNTLVKNTRGVRASGTDECIIQGNYIGTDESGNTGLGNTSGLSFNTNSGNHTIGGPNPGEGNVISGNTNGIAKNTAGGSLIQGNYIGTDPSGMLAIPNVTGIAAGTSGSAQILDNVISGNTGTAIEFIAMGSTIIQGNYIGVAADGSSPLGNATGFEAIGNVDNNTFGGLGLGEANIIAYNTGRAIDLSDTRVDNNAILGNSIFCNGEGIYLNGGNNDIPTPTITEVTTNSVGGMGVNSETIHVYRDNSGCTPGTPQGQEYLGTTTVDAFGNWQMTNVVINLGTDLITATATNGTDGTSEFTDQDDFIVTNTLDAGIGSFRWCVDNANNAVGPNTITFSNSIDGGVISLNSEITITSGNGDGTTIDGDIDGDHVPDITITQGGSNHDGLLINAADCDIRSLHMQGFLGVTRAAIKLDGSSATGNTIIGNYIGTSTDGNTAGTANYTGIDLRNGANGNFIGNGTATDRNIIGNCSFGVRINAANSTTISGNLIGISLNGSDIGSSRGVDVFNADGTIVGTVGVASNVISNNSDAGIQFNQSTNSIVLNTLTGVDESGLLDHGNKIGINVDNGSNNTQIGQAISGAGNVISGNTQEGINIEDSDNVSVLGNIIGLGSDGATVIPNGTSGPPNVHVDGSSSGTNIGDGTALGRNVISAGNGTGILISTGPTHVRGNYIGVDGTGVLDKGNGGAGISLAGGSGTIGGNNAGDRNVISGNSYGIGISAGGYSILGNYIGLNSSGNAAVPNNNQGIRLSVGSGTSIGDGTASGANFISGNNSDGILIENASTTGNSIDMNFIGLQANGTSALGNGANGILIESQANSNTISSNSIAYNTASGVEIGETGVSGIDKNTVTENLIYNNGGQGILLVNGANNGILPPVITSVTATTISGTGLDGHIIEVFIDNSSVNPQGEIYLGSDIVVGGTWSIGGSFTPTETFTATATDTDGNTSEYTVLAGTAPEISVYQGSDNTGTEIFLLGTADLGFETQGNNIVQTFAIENLGSTTLAINDIQSLATEFSVINAITEVAPGATETFSVTLAGSSVGSFTGTISIDNDDPSENPFDFTVSGEIIDLFEVTNTNDTGQGSLRWTIDNANNSLGANTITFNIPTSDPNYNGDPTNARWIITLLTDLPIITEELVLDATSQPGAGSYKIHIDGQGALRFGFEARARIEVYGMFMEGFSLNGSSAAIYCSSGSETSIIGAPGKGNLFNNNFYGIWTWRNDVVIQSNLFGTDETGSTAVPNNSGIFVSAGTNILIGGSLAAERNLLSGNTNYGIRISTASATVENNYIGTDITGLLALPNLNGIYVRGANTVIDNVISGNTDAGIESAESNGTVIQGNLIGVDKDGTLPLPNSIGIESGWNMDNNQIGGTGLGEGNIIAHNTDQGIFIENWGSEFNQIIGNSIYCNGQRNIDLNFSVTTEVGNDSKTAPDIISVVDGAVSGTGEDGDVIHVYRDNSGCVPVGADEYLGSTTVSSGNWTFNDGSILATDQMNATATDGSGNTSQFAVDFPDDWFTVVNTLDAGVGSFRRAIIRANSQTLSGPIIFDIPGTGPWVISMSSTLPAITMDNVVIEGKTQPGWDIDLGNLVTLDGSALSGLENGITINALNVEVYGLQVSNFPSNGIASAVFSTGAVIGAVGKGNVLNNNGSRGVSLGWGSSFVVGNRIGTDASGTTAAPNAAGGVGLANGSTVTDNLISGHNGTGDLGIFSNAVGGHTISNNKIGTDITGSFAIPNSIGMAIQTGGSTLIEDNLISGNLNQGIFMTLSSNNTVFGNKIGTDASGTAAIPNGIGIQANHQSGIDMIIGGLGVGEPNIIAFNTNAGISFVNASNENNDFIGNSIFCNGKGIDLGTDGNNGIQPPTITGITTTSVSGVGVNSETIHVYKDNSGCSSAQGQEYLGMATVDGSGSWSVTGLSIDPTTDLIVTTATSDADGTSEFSSVPLAPGDLFTMEISSNRINLTWADNSDDETGFAIERATDYGFTQNLVTYDIGSNAGATGTFSNTTTLASETAYFYRVKATNAGGSSGYSNVKAGTTITQPGNTLSFIGDDAVDQINGLVNNVVIPDDPSFDITDNFTLEAWIKTSVNKTQGIITNMGETGTFGYRMLLVGENVVFQYVGLGGLQSSISLSLNGSIKVNDNTWHHVSVVRDALDLKLYVDGVLDDNQMVNVQIDDGVGDIEIGSIWHGTGRNLFDGQIDEVRFWNVSRSQADIQSTLETSLDGDEPGLFAYYRFDQGFANNDNTSPAVNILPDRSRNNNHGTLNSSYELINSRSNWVTSAAFAVPRIRNATEVTPTDFVATWIPVNGAADHFIDVDDNIDFSSPIISNQSVGNSGTSVISIALTSGTDYYYRMRADDGQYSETERFRVDPDNALGFHAAANTRVDVPTLVNMSGQGASTIEAWFKVDAVSGVQTIYSEDIALGPVYILRVAGNVLQYGVYDGGTWSFSTGSTAIDAGKWYHAAGVYEDGVGTEVYLNGVLDGSNAEDGHMAQPQQSSLGRIALGGASDLFTGQLDEVRMWSKALSSAELQANLYKTVIEDPDLRAYYKFDQGIANGNNAGLTTVPDHSGKNYNATLANGFSLIGTQVNYVISGAYNPCAPSDLITTEISQSQIDLSWSDNSGNETNFVIERATDVGFTENLVTYSIGSNSGATGTFSNTSTLATETAYFYRVKATNVSGESAYSNIKVGTTITPPGNALDFDGVDDFVTAVNNDFVHGHQNLTVEAWIKPDYTNISAHGVIATTHAFGGPGGGYQMVIFPDGTVQFLYRDNTFTNRLVVSTQTLTEGSWYHVAGVIENAGSNSNIYLYINGQLETSLIGATGVPDYTNASNLFIGSNGDGVAGGNSLDREFGGEMDEVRIWSTARSQIEIQNHMTSTLIGNESGLVAYYKFDLGVPGGNNTSPAVQVLMDRSHSIHDGLMSGFALNGSSSNWVDSEALELPMLISNVSPTQNANNISPNTIIALDFDSDVNLVTANSSTILIRGSQTGIVSGVFQLNADNSIAEFDPNSDFKAGETITVTITDKVRGSIGETAVPYHFQFVVSSAVVNTPVFTQHDIGLSWSSPTSVHLADLNSDAEMDILTSAGGGDRIDWIENDGSETFGSLSLISSNINRPQEVMTADLNNDGHLDVISVSNDDDRIAWYENDGAENFTQRTITTSRDAWTAFPVDLDSDGDIDILANSNASDNDIFWYENDGNFPTPGFTEHLIEATAGVTRSLVAGDLDNDGDVDFAGAVSTHRLAWYQNDGNQSFTRFDVNNSAGFQESRHVHLVDLDDDGYLDILGAAQNGDKIVWHKNDGGSFTLNAENVISSSAQGAQSVYSGDIDGDGDTDVLSASTDDNRYIWYENDGSEVFTEKVIVDLVGTGANDIKAADVDSDGDLDVVASNGANIYYWFENGSNPIPNTPTNLITSEVLATQINLTWADNSDDETGFTIERATDYGFTQNLVTYDIGSNVGATGTFSNTTTLNPETAYFYRIKATNASGESGYSNIKAGTTITPAGNALDFDGVDDFVSIPHSTAFGGAPSDDFTWSVWVKVPTDITGGNGTSRFIIGKSTSFVPTSAFDRTTISINKSTGIISAGIQETELNNQNVTSTSDLRDNKWHHISFVRDRTADQVILYIDGQVEDIITDNDNDGSNTEDLWIGDWGRIPQDGRLFKGEIDEVRIWSSARSQSEISSDMLSTLIGDEENLVAYYRFDQGIANGDNTSPLVNVLPDRSQNQFDGILTGFTLTGDASNWVESDAQRPIVYQATNVTKTGFTANWQAVAGATDILMQVDDDPDFGSPLIDDVSVVTGGTASILQSLNIGIYFYRIKANIGGTITNYSLSSEFTLPPGHALDFDGVDDVVIIPNNPSIDFGDNDFTVEFWISTASTVGDSRIITKHVCGFPNGWIIYMNNDGSIGFFHSSVGVGSTKIINDGFWHHIAATFAASSNTQSIYVDGVLSASVVGNDGISSSAPLTIGAFADPACGPTGTQPIDARIDEVRIWSSTRALSEIQDNMLSELVGNESGLVAYYDFNEGIADGDNTSPAVNVLPDLTSNGNDGALTNFDDLTGSVSNWTVSKAFNPFGPTDLFTTEISSTQIDLSWTDNSLNEDGFIIERSTDYGFVENVETYSVSSNAGATATFSNTSTLATETAYFYRVKATNASGDSGYSNIKAGTTITPPGNGLAFDGSNNNAVAIPDSPSIDFGDNDFTAEMWISTTDSNLGVLFAKHTCGIVNGWVVHLGSSGEIFFRVGSSNIGGTIPINDGNWHHVAVTNNGSTNVQSIYVDGVLDVSVVGADGTPTNDEPLAIGAWSSTACGGLGNQAITGTIDEVRIWNVERTLGDIQSDLYSTLAATESGLVAYYRFDQGIANGDNTTPVTVDLLPDRSQNQNNGILNNFLLNGDASNWVDGVKLNQPTNLLVDATYGFNSPEVVLTWKDNTLLEEDYQIERATNSTFTTDLKTFILGGANTGTVSTFTDNTVVDGTLYFYRVKALGGDFDSDYSNTITAVPVVESGNAASFDSNSEFIEVPATIQNRSDWSFSCWFKDDGMTTNQKIYSEGSPNVRLAIEKFSWEQGIRVGVLNGSWQYIFSSPTIPGEWNFMAFSVSGANNSGGTAMIMVNNTVVTGDMHVLGASVNRAVFGKNVGDAFGSQPPQAWIGEIDEASIWSRALDEAEMRAIRDAGVPAGDPDLISLWHFDEPNSSTTVYDASGNENHGTRNSGAQQVTSEALHPFAPENFQVVPQDGQVELQWVESFVEDFKQYNISYKLNSDVSYTTITETDVASNSITIAGLSNSSLYDFKVSATDVVDQLGPETEIHEVPEDFAGNAAFFDGTNSSISVSDNNIFTRSTGLTLEAWIRPDNLNNSFQFLAGVSSSFGLRINDSNELEAFSNSGGGTVLTSEPASILTEGNWHHVAMTFDGVNTVNLFVNGQKVHENISMPAPQNASEPFWIGKNNSSTIFFEGLMDEVRLWDQEVDQATLQANMFTPLRGDETNVGSFNANLIGLWHFDEPTGHPTAYSTPSNLYNGTLGGNADFVLSGAMASPEIMVFVGSDNSGMSVTNGQVTAIDVGVSRVGDDIVQVFAIENNGTTTLDISSIVSDESFFTVDNSITAIGVGEIATFSVTLSAANTGTFSANITIANNDWDEGTYIFPLTGQIVEPEIVVYNGTDNASPEITDAQVLAVDFGAALINNDISKTFAIENTGTSVLNISSITSSATEYTVSGVPASVGVGITETFTISLDGSASGSFNATITINSDDADENPFTFPVTGEITVAPDPEIVVYNGSNNTSPEIADAQSSAIDFGSAVITNDITRTFAIENSGTSVLNISSVTSSASEYTISGVPASVGVGITETFTISLDGSTSGSFDATITINSDDADENPFTFPVTGEITVAPDPEIVVYNGSNNTSPEIADAQSSAIDFGSALITNDITRTFAIENTGTSTLNIGSIESSISEFIVTAVPATVAVGATETFVVTLDGLTSGTFNSIVTINSDDSDESTFTFPLTGQITEPEIAVYDGPDSASPEVTDAQVTAIDFGSAVINNEITRTIAIENTGTSVLNISSIASSATGFAVSDVPVSVGVGAVETFVVTLEGSASGMFSSIITINSDDEDEGLFTFPVSGEITEPEIAIFLGSDNSGTVVSDAQVTAIDFGSATEGNDIVQTFAIENSGTSDLAISSITSNGSEFTIASVPSVISPGSTETFTITLDGTNPGDFNSTIIIASDDLDEESFTFTVSGSITAPEINVFLGADNSGTLILTGQVDVVDIGAEFINNDITQTFAIQNTGTSDLNVNSIQVSTSDFAVSNSISVISAGATEIFSITLNGSAVGTFNATVTIVSDDSDESDFNFPITGQIEAELKPEIGVFVGADNSGAVVTNNQTDLVHFGSAMVGEDLSVIFSIENTGNEVLTISEIAVTGSVFSVSGAITSVGVGELENFSIILSASNPGNFEAMVTISSDDTDESLFGFPIRGIIEGVNVIDGNNPSGNVLISNQEVDLGSTVISKNIEKSFVIENLSQSNELIINRITSNNVAFVVEDIPSRVPVSSFVEFKVVLVANIIGTYTGTISVSTSLNDFVFAVKGQVTEGELPQLNVFNAVTPNGDQIHDFLKIENIEFYPDNQLVIYNRIGDKVFESKGYDNISNTFEGISNVGSNKELDTGNYFYTIDKGDGSGKETGFVFLKR